MARLPVRMAPGAMILLAAALTAGCSPGIANRDAKGTAIIAFGDSLTQGMGARQGEDYPSRLAATLGMEVVNAGIGGATTQDALRRLDEDVLAHNPRLVIVEFGANDFLQQQPREEIFANLDAIVRRIVDHGAMVVVVAVKPGLLFDPVRKDFERVARAHGAAFVPDILSGILTNPSLRSDHIHPNGAGYVLVAERIHEVVEPLVR